MSDTKTPPSKQPVNAASLIAENIKFELTIPWKDVQKGYAATLDRITATVELKGFRKGKAPKKLVEEKVGKSKIYEESVSAVISPAYTAEIIKRKLKPIVEPHVHPKSLEENKDWVFEIEVAEMPEVKLGDYKDAVKSARAKDVLWTPGKDEKKPAPTEEEKLRNMFQALLEKIQVRIPEMLLANEVNRSLSKFLQQLDKLHIPLEDYLKSVNKTVDQLRQEYAGNALATLQLEFILAEISRVEKLSATDAEIDKVLADLPDEQLRKANNTPAQRANISTMLVRRKTIDSLLAL